MINSALLPEIRQRWKNCADEGTLQPPITSGWQSPKDLLFWKSSKKSPLGVHIAGAAQALMKAALTDQPHDVSGELLAEAWATVLTDGTYLLPHRHEGFVWSGVYYVDAGNGVLDDGASATDLSGVLRLMDPRPSAPMEKRPGHPHGSSLTIQPKTGLFVAFPSWLTQMVLPYRGADPQISISFKVTYGSFSIEGSEECSGNSSTVGQGSSL